MEASRRGLEAQPATSTVPACAWRRRLADVGFVELGDDARARPLYARVLAQGGVGCDEPGARHSAATALGDLELRRGEPAAAVVAYADVRDAAVRVRRGFALLALRLARRTRLVDFTAARGADDADARLGKRSSHSQLRAAEAEASLAGLLRRARSRIAAPRRHDSSGSAPAERPRRGGGRQQPLGVQRRRQLVTLWRASPKSMSVLSL